MIKTKNIAIAFSESSTNEGTIKDISRRIKSNIVSSPIHLMLLFFTPHYKPSVLKEVIDITLRPKNILGIQSPAVIFQDRIFKKGVVACCLSGEGLDSKTFFMKGSDPEQTESILRKNIISTRRGKRLMLCALGRQIKTQNYIRGVELSLGRGFNIFGAGFIKKYGVKNFQVANNIVEEGASHIILSGNLAINYKIMSGFVPLGKTFKITKASPERNVILEINNRPASLIYKKYFQSKFEIFKKTSLGTVYPIGIRENGYYRIVNILDFLEDDSLFCMGEIQEGKEARIMMATPQSMLEEIKRITSRIKIKGEHNLAIIFNSLMRRNILKIDADKEIELIKTILGEKTKIIGLYTDYQIFPEENTGEFSIENNSLCMLLLNYGNH